MQRRLSWREETAEVEESSRTSGITATAHHAGQVHKSSRIRRARRSRWPRAGRTPSHSRRSHSLLKAVVLKMFLSPSATRCFGSLLVKVCDSVAEKIIIGLGCFFFFFLLTHEFQLKHFSFNCFLNFNMQRRVCLMAIEPNSGAHCFGI